MSRRALYLVLGLLITLSSMLGARQGSWFSPEPATPASEIRVAELPPEARQTLRLIAQGGPFPYDRDGIVFGNHEQRLPGKPRGYYHEYTVPTPGQRNRGPRRLIAGDGGERYYTADHYETFQRVRE